MTYELALYRAGHVVISRSFSIQDVMNMIATDDPSVALKFNGLTPWGRRDNKFFEPLPPLCYLRVNGIDIGAKVSVGTHEIYDERSNTKWSSIHMVPHLFSPEARYIFSKRTFDEIFSKYCIGDIETNAKFELIPRKSKARERIHRRQLFGSNPLMSLSKYCGYVPLLFDSFLYADSVDNSEFDKITQYSNSLGTNISRLIGLLREGRLEAQGFWRDDMRKSLPIDPLVWCRGDLQINLFTGDISFCKSGEIEWRSVSFVSPTDEMQRSAAPAANTKMEAVIKWLRRKYPDGRPAGVSGKQHLKDIAEELRLTVSARTLNDAIKLAFGTKATQK